MATSCIETLKKFDLLSYCSHAALRLISTPGATDMDEADALSWQNGVVDIYSNSWGPEDTGYTVSGPGDLLERVLETSAREVCVEFLQCPGYSHVCVFTSILW